MFESARIKLTVWYLFIIMIVSSFFSVIVYRGFTKELGRGFRMQSLRSELSNGPLIYRDNSGYRRILPFVIYPDEIPPEEFLEIINFAKRRFALQLLIINGGILILAGTAGYFLAGKTLQPIEDMVSKQKRFISDASHELRTPLTSLKTQVEVSIRDKKLNLKTAIELLKNNLQEIDKIKKLTDNLLYLGRYESGYSGITLEDVDLSEAIKQGIARNLVLAKTKNIKIEKKLLPVIVKGNPQGLVELFSILINNAIKYSKNGKSVTIDIKKQRNFVIIEASDTGVGISHKDIKHVFDRFYRADSSRTSGGSDGFGLGLSIAKSIVEMHRGEIKVESEVEKGSKFIVKLLV